MGLVTAACRRRRKKADPAEGIVFGPEALKGGSRTAIRVTGPVPVPCAPWRTPVHFADMAEFYEFEDDGLEPYELGNTWLDGTPRVRYRRGVHQPHVPGSIARSVVRAHYDAALLFAGQPFGLPHPRAILFNGRVPYYEAYDEADDDVFGTVDPIEIDLSEANYNSYTHKPLAFWTDVDVTMIDFETMEVITLPFEEGFARLHDNWHWYWHLDGDGRRLFKDDFVGASTDEKSKNKMRKVGDIADGILAAACSHEPIEWIVDTGAAIHCVTYNDRHRGRFKQTRLDSLFTCSGVGQNVCMDWKAEVSLPDLGVTINPFVLPARMGDTNLLSVSLLAEESIDLIWLRPCACRLT